MAAFVLFRHWLQELIMVSKELGSDARCYICTIQYVESRCGQNAFITDESQRQFEEIIFHLAGLCAVRCFLGHGDIKGYRVSDVRQKFNLIVTKLKIN